MKTMGAVLTSMLGQSAGCALGLLLMAGWAGHSEEKLGVHNVARLRPRVDETKPPGSQPAWEEIGKTVTVTTIPLRVPVTGLVYGEGAVWVIGRKFAKIDPGCNCLSAQFKEASGSAVAAGEGSVWAIKFFELKAHDLLRLDPQTGAVQGRVSGIAHHRGGPVVGEGSVWVHVGGEVLRIDPKTEKIVATIPTLGSVGTIAFGEGAVWVLEQTHLWPNSEHLLSRIDPTSNRLTQTIHLGSGFSSIAVGEGAVWVAQSGSGTPRDPTPGKLLRIETQPLQIVRAIPLWWTPVKMLIAAGSIWVSTYGGGAILRVDPRANQVTEMLLIPGKGSLGGGLVSGAGALWAGKLGGLASGCICRIELSDFADGQP